MTKNRFFLFPMYRLWAVAAACCGAAAMSLTYARADEALWKTSFAEAIAEASQQDKHILLYFTGSDWCPPCRKMDQEVLSQKRFSELATKSLILVKLDFPRRKKLSANEKAQNDQLLWKHLDARFNVAAPDLASLRAMYRRAPTLIEHQQLVTPN